jgi:predicted RNase H-like HicB family nuclease
MKSTYRATATRTGRRWAIEVPELPGAHSQARRLDQVESMAREAIALLLGAGEDAFDVTVQPDLSSLGSLKDSIEEALRAREAAELAQSKASAAVRHAVREIRDSGYTSRDTGMLLGVTNQRISQLEKDR